MMTLRIDLAEERGLEPQLQYPELPTGCESVALTLLLRWCGCAGLAAEEIARRLPKEPQPTPLIENADFNADPPQYVGGNPHRGFVGDPFCAESFGVFHEPLEQTLRQYLTEHRKLPWRAIDLTGKDFEHLEQRLRDRLAPIVCWVTLELRDPYVKERWQDWQRPEPQDNIIWTSPEHCLLLVGLNGSDKVVVLDPHTGRKDEHDRERFKLRYEQLGKQALSVERIQPSS
jgi:uncharacterized protein YvpB